MPELDRLKMARLLPETPPLNTKHSAQRPANTQGTKQPSFQDLLRARQGLATDPLPATQALKFSAHAQSRLQSRQIAMEGAQMNRLEDAVQRAADKGSRDALVLMDDLAMVVSVKNRTVITVVDKESLKQNVFTNIDSAVIA